MSTRIKGRQLKLEIGSPPVDYWADVTACELQNEEADSDVVTFEDASQPGGAMVDFLQITAVQSTDAESLWSYIWDHAGESVDFAYAPHGNAEPTAAQPHFIGTCTIGPRPAVGGEAGRDNTFTFESRWDVEGRVVMDRGTP